MKKKILILSALVMAFAISLFAFNLKETSASSSESENVKFENEDVVLNLTYSINSNSYIEEKLISSFVDGDLPTCRITFYGVSYSCSFKPEKYIKNDNGNIEFIYKIENLYNLMHFFQNLGTLNASRSYLDINYKGNSVLGSYSYKTSNGALFGSNYYHTEYTLFLYPTIEGETIKINPSTNLHCLGKKVEFTEDYLASNYDTAYDQGYEIGKQEGIEIGKSEGKEDTGFYENEPYPFLNGHSSNEKVLSYVYVQSDFMIKDFSDDITFGFEFTLDGMLGFTQYISVHIENIEEEVLDENYYYTLNFDYRSLYEVYDFILQVINLTNNDMVCNETISFEVSYLDNDGKNKEAGLQFDTNNNFLDYLKFGEFPTVNPTEGFNTTVSLKDDYVECLFDESFMNEDYLIDDVKEYRKKYFDGAYSKSNGYTDDDLENKYNDGFDAGANSVDITSDNEEAIQEHIKNNNYHTDEEFNDYGSQQYQTGYNNGVSNTKAQSFGHRISKLFNNIFRFLKDLFKGELF